MGKYTIARKLSDNYGFIICDNQLVNNSIFELLQYDSHAKIPEFAWDSIARIRDCIFEFLTKIPNKSIVFTNNLYEEEGDRKLYQQIEKMSLVRGSLFVPVRFLKNANF
jgi:hypothetical protein